MNYSIFRTVALAVSIGSLLSVAPAQQWSTVTFPPYSPAVIPASPPTMIKMSGSSNRMIGINSGFVFYTADGESWLRSNLNEIVTQTGYYNGQFWARNDAHIYLSNDGSSWTLAGQMPDNDGPVEQFVLTRDGAVCTKRFFGPQIISKLYTSADLISWQEATPLPEVNPNRYPSLSRAGLIQGGDTTVVNYWIYGEGILNNWPLRRIAWSEDRGLTWQKSQVEKESPPSTLAFGNGLFLGIDGNGTVILSSDGARTFQESKTAKPATLYSEAAFAGGRFMTRLTTLEATQLYASIDGHQWEAAGELDSHWSPADVGMAYGFGRYFLNNLRLASEPGWSPPPVLLDQPKGTITPVGRRLTLAVTTYAGAPETFQWRKDGVEIAGAQTATYAVPRASSQDAAVYECVVTNTVGTVTSNRASIEVIPATAGGRLVNLSVNSLTGPGDSALNVGFVIQGPDAKSLLVRAIGPGLEQFGITDALTDPRLKLISGGTTVAENDNWTGDDGRDLGAFRLVQGSRDSALRNQISNGVYSVLIDQANEGPGRVLTELYDGNLEAAETLVSNLSTRGIVQPGEKLIVGFVVGGETALDLVIRVVGPSLEQFGLSNALADPTITLFSGESALGTNDNWLGDDGRRLGAFPLETDSLDSVLSVRLTPGVYTTQVTSADSNASAGIILLELYDAN